MLFIGKGTGGEEYLVWGERLKRRDTNSFCFCCIELYTVLCINTSRALRPGPNATFSFP